MNPLGWQGPGVGPGVGDCVGLPVVGGVEGLCVGDEDGGAVGLEDGDDVGGEVGSGVGDEVGKAVSRHMHSAGLLVGCANTKEQGDHALEGYVIMQAHAK